MAIRGRKTLLLDLDGTLVDPGPGIVAGYRHALLALGVNDHDDDDLRWVIGPPLRQNLIRLLGKSADIDAAVDLYRSLYAEQGLYQAEVYPGVTRALEAHRRRGTQLILCTGKPHVLARRVIEHFELSHLLDGLYGPELDGRYDDKGDLINLIIRSEGLDPDEVCMVGDRYTDVVAASRHKIPTVGVLWGYGSREELKAARADAIIESPAQLLPPARVRHR